MRMGAMAKRWTYLLHRWMGVAGCLLMLLWFVSGVVMLYVGYPKLTPWERLAPLPALDPAACCVPLARLPDAARGGGAVVLTSIGGKPAYVMRKPGSAPGAYDALTGAPREAPVSAAKALASARAFAKRPAHYAGLVDVDRWTHSRGLDVHRPLHKVHVDGLAPASLYVSSRTGEVVLDAPVAQQRWNYVGAWLHWLYMLRSGSSDQGWAWTVIALSALCTLLAVSGLCVGLWRWRFRGRYKSGSRSPYREPWMKWHHVVGLLFSGVVCTWIFSGLMSMNPMGVFSADQRPNEEAYRTAATPVDGGLTQPARVIEALRTAGFAPVELQWRAVGGDPYVLAYDAAADTRIVRQVQGRLSVAVQFDAADVLPAARRLFDAPLHAHSVMPAYDAYYYQRHPEAMNGALQYGLPALRLDFGDSGRTRVYIDLRTGEVARSLSVAQRAGRWLFYLLHSWDMPILLRGGAWRDAILILLSIGGAIVAATGTVIGIRRLRATMPGRRT
ncbi:PepSY domain-containing protein [Pusillimonas sp. TS35]|nr:PepSY-associated TM helix domain-containing protein [Paracandidimonas lactea]MYN12370.1 PepSY domain-containing protein [Pusillimonas sp. TS35]